MLTVLVLLFALIGLLFSAVFVAMQFDLLNVRGTIEARNEFFVAPEEKPRTAIPGVSSTSAVATVTKGEDSCLDGEAVCAWNDTREWGVVAGGLEKDAAVIQRVSVETDVSARLIAAVVVPEQIRFFSSEREVFKRYFEPLKILGSLSKFSLGVSGIKQETAVRIEEHLHDQSSDFYPGAQYAELIAYDQDVKNKSETLFARLTNEKDHYYSYLYTALFIKEIEAQWERAGHADQLDPAIVATIFNLGFSASEPKADPKVGGAPITVGGKQYSFGDLAGRFYDSVELVEIFAQ